MTPAAPAFRPTRITAAARAAFGAFTLVVLAAVASSAWAQQPPPPPPADGARPSIQRLHDMPGPGGGPGMRGHGGPEGFGPGLLHGSPERMNRSIDRMLDGLGVSDAQRAQIKDIAAKASADVRAQMQAGRGQPGKAADALLAPQIDAGAIEAARQQRLQLHDQMSRRISQAMVDMARVLTPEQRAKALARVHDRQARMEDRRQRMESAGPRGGRGPGMPPSGARPMPPATAPSTPR